jgi:hypothetical protein
MHEDEMVVTDHLTDFVARLFVGAHRCDDGNAAVPHDFRRDEPDAQDVGIAVLFAESEPFRKMGAHDVAIEQCDGAAARFDMFRQDLRDCRFACAAESGEPDTAAALTSRGAQRRAPVLSVVALTKYSGRRTTSA